MPGWGWFLIGLGGALVVVLILWLLFRSKGGANTAALKESEAQRLRDELEAERKAKEAVTEELKALAEEKRRIDSWYNQVMNQINEEAKDEYKRLATDTAALDAKLDSLLGVRPAEDEDTDPDGEGPPAEG